MGPPGRHCRRQRSNHGACGTRGRYIGANLAEQHVYSPGRKTGRRSERDRDQVRMRIQREERRRQGIPGEQPDQRARADRKCPLGLPVADVAGHFPFIATTSPTLPCPELVDTGQKDLGNCR